MGFQTRAFDFFYKRLGPTGSVNNITGYLPEFWHTASSTIGGYYVSGAFLNYPDDTLSTTYLTTQQATYNATYRALPWGSHANDFLWNCMTPSWSYVDSTITSTYNYTLRTWTMVGNTNKSFNRFNRAGGTSYGVTSYPVTSSWHVVDGMRLSYIGIPTYPTLSSFYYVTYGGQFPASLYPTFVGSYPSVGTEASHTVAYNISYPLVTSASDSTGKSISAAGDGYFDRGGGCGITKTLISESLVTASVYGSSTSAAGIKTMTEGLKNRRLFFPVPVSGSGTNGGTDYWFKQYTGLAANTLFETNGGIYNVQFSLKKISNAYSTAYSPDTGTYMKVFIADVTSSVPAPSGRIPGAAGWYPPDNNIITIGNGYDTTPTMTFQDIQTGYTVEKFNINVIQYGYPAQFCIEVSGSLADDKYFGIIVDDIQICKIGVTTDPRFVKPTSIAQTITNINTQKQASQGSGGA